MKNKSSFVLAGIVMCAFIPVFSGSLRAASLRDVVINEIAWMGTAASTYDEWIELYNTGLRVSEWVIL